MVCSYKCCIPCQHHLPRKAGLTTPVFLPDKIYRGQELENFSPKNTSTENLLQKYPLAVQQSLCISSIYAQVKFSTSETLKTNTELFLLQQQAFQSNLSCLLFTVNYLENDAMKISIIYFQEQNINRFPLPPDFQPLTENKQQPFFTSTLVAKHLRLIFYKREVLVSQRTRAIH